MLRQIATASPHVGGRAATSACLAAAWALHLKLASDDTTEAHRMQPLPHFYSVRALAKPEGNVRIGARDLPAVLSAPPKEFDGPGDQWSPEELFLASVVDCFALTFRAVASASGLGWAQLSAGAEGILDRVDRTTRFTEIVIHVALTLEDPARDEARARRVLEKSEANCPVSRSLAVPVQLDIELVGLVAGTE